MLRAGLALSLMLCLACSESAPPGSLGPLGGGGASGRGGAGGGAGGGASGSGAGGDAGYPGGGGSGAGCGLVTCASANANCGPIGDGCGGVVQCGDCPPTETCGGAGVPSRCGAASCVPRTCAEAGADCGPVGDGCGGLLQCGDCMAPDSCGGGGVASRCGQGGGAGMGGGGGCTPRTCAQLGANCGPVSDGCGGLLQCGDCVAPDICGGGGTPNVCGGGAGGAGGSGCVNLCPRQMPCPGGGTTTLSGTVYAPTPPQFGNPDPLYDALVYVPNAPVLPFTPGVSCQRCDALATGNPLVTTLSDARGRFRLENVPVGPNVPLVIQVGRWRRQVTVPNVVACQDNPLPAELTRLPRNQQEGDIPRIAMVTGDVDPLECVLRKIGLDEAEFTAPSGAGRVHFYLHNGANAGAGTLDQDDLWSRAATLHQYDQVILACSGSEDRTYSDRYAQVLRDYTSAGGRLFATHWQYGWLDRVDPFLRTAQWASEMEHNTFPMPDPLRGLLDTSFPKGAAFAEWLGFVGALVAPGEIDIYNPRHDVNAALPPARRWISTVTPATVQHYTFNTPVAAPAESQCGRVVFSSFHVTATVPGTFPHTGGMRFPTECTMGPLTPQEKVLEFMLFDLAACIAPDQPICTPRTCADQGLSCGPAGDGCGGVLDCGTCTPPQTCGGGGQPGVCGGGTCTARTCAQQNIECGPAGDGCGGLLDCGDCTPPLVCGGGGQPGRCGNRPCTPRTCAEVGAQCGLIGDGCGGQVDCGPCTFPEQCGAISPNRCGTIG